MLPPRGFDQAIDGVVGVLRTRFDALVAEVDRLLGIVADVGDVADGIVGVVQVLHLAAGPPGLRRLWAIAGEGDSVSAREQMHKTGGQRVVGVGGSDAVPVLNQRALALRIVRSEEHTSELQSLAYLVCRLLLEKKKN